MGNTSTAAVFAPGSAARAAAAEHNHGKAAAHHHDTASDRAFHHDMDEDMSDDTRIAKKPRCRRSKFSSVMDADNGYDSMEIDNGVDEVTDRRRSKPSKRKGMTTHTHTLTLTRVHA